MRAIRALTLALLFGHAARTDWEETSIGFDLDKLPRFPLKKVSAESLATIAPAQGMAPFSHQVELRGAGKDGKRWKVFMNSPRDAWRGDLDGNGADDFVFFSGGPYFNGRNTPVFSIRVLLMDAAGLPSPFFTAVFRKEHAAEMKAITDLDRDGRAEILSIIFDEYPSDPLSLCSGHWTTRAYRFRNESAEAVRGNLGPLRFPFIHDWSLPERCGKSSSPLRRIPPDEVSYETTPESALSVTVRGLRNATLLIDPKRGCQTILPHTLVIDTATERTIAFETPQAPWYDQTLHRIARPGALVELRGVLRESGSVCRANVVWASR